MRPKRADELSSKELWDSFEREHGPVSDGRVEVGDAGTAEREQKAEPAGAET